ncbi:YebO family protein [Pantoea sp. CTOTU49201]|uniref:YebO family protein n=1 Tax=Pantoea sp. CTOTU49201 TaxID=2953855 RepID=UPI0028A195AC|nr:YebO family protein [Pantoea sp. CTOTU49201]
MGNSDLIWTLIICVISIIIWFYVNRASVRANRQVELLESIDKKLSKLVGEKAPDNGALTSAAKILEDARKKQGL